MPARAWGETFFGDPAVIVLFAIGFAAAEEEAGAGLTALAFETERPVLVFGCEGLVLVSAFADEVDVAAVVEGVDADPSFDHEGLAKAEAEIEVREVGFFDLDVAVFASEDSGFIANGEAGVDGFLWACGSDEGFTGKGAGFPGVKGPLDERGGLGDGSGVVLRSVFGLVFCGRGKNAKEEEEEGVAAHEGWERWISTYQRRFGEPFRIWRHPTLGGWGEGKE